MTYVDGFVIPIAKKDLPAYRRIAAKAGKIWREHGALQYFECVGDDLSPDIGGMTGTPFPKMAKLKPSETVVFSFIIYTSKSDRNRVNAKVMKDPRIAAAMAKVMPFDVKRMAWGGFKVIVEEDEA